MTIELKLSTDQEVRLLAAQAKVDREAALAVLLEALRPAVARLIGQDGKSPGTAARQVAFHQLTANMTREYQKLEEKPARIASTREEIYGDDHL